MNPIIERNTPDIGSRDNEKLGSSLRRCGCNSSVYPSQDITACINRDGKWDEQFGGVVSDDVDNEGLTGTFNDALAGLAKLGGATRPKGNNSFKEERAEEASSDDDSEREQ